MFKNTNPYTLRTEVIVGTPYYFVSFKDGQADFHEIEISSELYNEFRSFENQDKREQNFFERHIERSELTDATLNKRAINIPADMLKSIKEILFDKDYSIAFWKTVGTLPVAQRRRLLLYYEYELTYKEIARVEGCTTRAVEYSIAKARKKIIEKFNN